MTPATTPFAKFTAYALLDLVGPLKVLEDVVGAHRERGGGCLLQGCPAKATGTFLRGCVLAKWFTRYLRVI